MGTREGTMQIEYDMGRVLRAIRRYQAAAGYPPTQRELQRLTGFYSNKVCWLVCLLDADGYIARRPRSPRGIRLLARGRHDA